MQSESDVRMMRVSTEIRSSNPYVYEGCYSDDRDRDLKVRPNIWDGHTIESCFCGARALGMLSFPCKCIPPRIIIAFVMIAMGHHPPRTRK